MEDISSDTIQVRILHTFWFRSYLRPTKTKDETVDIKDSLTPRSELNPSLTPFPFYFPYSIFCNY